MDVKGLSIRRMRRIGSVDGLALVDFPVEAPSLRRRRQIERIVVETIHQRLDVVPIRRALQRSRFFVPTMTPLFHGTLLQLKGGAEALFHLPSALA
ncbi:MAG: hypothetical protein ACFCVK_07210 [Acidimicrobiales bacterium]